MQPSPGVVELQRRGLGVGKGCIKRALLKRAADHCDKLHTATDTTQVAALGHDKGHNHGGRVHRSHINDPTAPITTPDRAYVAAFVHEHGIHPVIERSVAFADLPQAYRGDATAGVFGKSVIIVH